MIMNTGNNLIYYKWYERSLFSIIRQEYDSAIIIKFNNNQIINDFFIMFQEKIKCVLAEKNNSIKVI